MSISGLRSPSPLLHDPGREANLVRFFIHRDLVVFDGRQLVEQVIRELLEGFLGRADRGGGASASFLAHDVLKV